VERLCPDRRGAAEDPVRGGAVCAGIWRPPEPGSSAFPNWSNITSRGVIPNASTAAIERL
jgi:hypothetical protein